MQLKVIMRQGKRSARKNNEKSLKKGEKERDEEQKGGRRESRKCEVAIRETPLFKRCKVKLFWAKT